MSSLASALRHHVSKEAWHQIAFQPALADLVFMPSRVVHPSWRRTLLSEDIGEQVWTCNSAQPDLSRHIQQVLDLPELQCVDLTHPAWTVSLLPGDRLQALSMHLGATLLGNEIRRVVDKASLNCVLQQIDSALYQFVMERAGLIYMEPEPMSVGKATVHQVESIGQRIHMTGRSLLQHYVSDCDAALWARVQLKLEYREPQVATQPEAMIPIEILRRMVPKTIREIN